MNVVECYIPIFMFVGVREMDPDLTFMAQMPEEQLQVFVETLIEKGGLLKHYLFQMSIKSMVKTMRSTGVELKKNIEILVAIQ